VTALVHIVGTDTGIGKSHLLQALTHGLRKQHYRVWIHKPIACGEWDGSTAEDGRIAASLVGDEQDPTTACPLQYPTPISPHLAAAAAGAVVHTQTLINNATALLEAATQHEIDYLLIEGAGGLFSPLSNDGGNQQDLLQALPGTVILATRPDLGTINHTALTAFALQQGNTPAQGIVINYSRDSSSSDPATATAAAACSEATGLDVWQEIPFGSSDVSPILTRLTNRTSAD
jgi:dethiobiotin synthetase